MESGFAGLVFSSHLLNCHDKKGCEEGDSGLEGADRNRLGTLGFSQEGEKEVVRVDGRDEEGLVISFNEKTHRKQWKDGFRGVESKGRGHDRNTESNCLGELCQRGEQMREDDLQTLPLCRAESLGIVKKAEAEKETFVA